MSDVRDPETDQQIPVTNPESECVFTEGISLVEEGVGMGVDPLLESIRDVLLQVCERAGIDPADMLRERQALGIKKYGQSLMTFDGRDTALEMLQEVADLYIYTVKMQMESERTP